MSASSSCPPSRDPAIGPKNRPPLSTIGAHSGLTQGGPKLVCRWLADKSSFTDGQQSVNLTKGFLCPTKRCHQTFSKEQVKIFHMLLGFRIAVFLNSRKVSEKILFKIRGDFPKFQRKISLNLGTYVFLSRKAFLEGAKGCRRGR